MTRTALRAAVRTVLLATLLFSAIAPLSAIAQQRRRFQPRNPPYQNRAPIPAQRYEQPYRPSADPRQPVETAQAQDRSPRPQLGQPSQIQPTHDPQQTLQQQGLTPPPTNAQPDGRTPPGSDRRDATGGDGEGDSNTITVADPVEEAANNLTVDSLEKQEESATAGLAEDDPNHARIAELFAEARKNLERSDTLSQRSETLRELASSVENRAKSQAELDKQLDSTEPRQPGETEVDALNEKLTFEQGELRKRKERKRMLDEQAASRATRQTEIRQRLSQLDDEIATVKQALGAVALAGESNGLAVAKRMAKLARLKPLLVEEPALRNELDLFSVEASANLLKHDRSVNAKRIAIETKQVQLIADALQLAREKSAGSVLAEAKRDEQYVPDRLRPIAENSLKLAEENQSLIVKLQRAQAEYTKVTTKLDQLKQQFATSRAKEKSVGLLASVGAMLRSQRGGLPDARALRTSNQSRLAKIDETQLQIFELDDETSRLADIESAAKRELEELAVDGKSPISDSSLKAARQLLESRREVLERLQRNQQAYFESLTNTSIAQEELARLADDFQAYIDERVMWIRSHPPLHHAFSIGDVEKELALAQQLKQAPSIVSGLVRDAQRQPIVYFVSASFVGLLLVLRLTFVGRLKKIAARARSSAYSYFSPSLTALFINAVSCLFEPAVLGFVGWRLISLTKSTLLATAVGKACIVAAVLLLPLSFFRRVFARNGLADAHFDWPANTTTLLRRNLGWITATLVPLAFLSTTVLHLQPPGSANFLPQVLFLIACLTVALFLWRILHPTGGLPSNYLASHQGSWVERLQHIWFWAIVAIPLALAILVVSGYTYTARELAWRGFQTIVIVGFLWVLHALFMRLILVHRRKLSMERARERYAEFQRQQKELKEQQKQAIEANADSDQASDENVRSAIDAARKRVYADLPGVVVTPDGIEVEQDPLADLRANTAQSRRLVTTLVIGTGIIFAWMTWHNVLPALGFLERWPLWNSSREVTETITNDEGLQVFRTSEVLDPVTIADLFLACLVTGLSFVAARDLPGLLELSILKRLPLENSIRYAITTLSSYGIVFLGLFIACRCVGLRWQQIQWMATALTFGLAFGLQEMFANFVAGVIILFERPIRVGDIVTLDNVSGVVSKVRMRATTVTNWDRKDYIVPNKDFITGRLLNWTRSDQVSRIVINVGIAYGSDIAKAKELLLGIARDHVIVEDEPEPMTTFEEFGDSALKIVLRCFIAMENMPMRLNVIDQLHSSIDAKYKEAGIAIAFPQQDVWLREVPDSLRGAGNSRRSSETVDPADGPQGA